MDMGCECGQTDWFASSVRQEGRSTRVLQCFFCVLINKVPLIMEVGMGGHGVRMWADRLVCLLGQAGREKHSSLAMFFLVTHFRQVYIDFAINGREGL